MAQGILKKLDTELKTTYLDNLKMNNFVGSISFQIKAYNEGQNVLGAGIGKKGNRRAESCYRVYSATSYSKTSTRTFLQPVINIKKKKRGNGNEKSRAFWKISLMIDVVGLGDNINLFLEKEQDELYKKVRSIFLENKYDVYLDESEREVVFNEKFRRKVV